MPSGSSSVVSSKEGSQEVVSKGFGKFRSSSASTRSKRIGCVLSGYFTKSVSLKNIESGLT